MSSDWRKCIEYDVLVIYVQMSVNTFMNDNENYTSFCE